MRMRLLQSFVMLHVPSLSLSLCPSLAAWARAGAAAVMMLKETKGGQETSSVTAWVSASCVTPALPPKSLPLSQLWPSCPPFVDGPV